MPERARLESGRDADLTEPAAAVRSGRAGRGRPRCSSGNLRKSLAQDRSGPSSRRRRGRAGRRRSRRRTRFPCTSRCRGSAVVRNVPPSFQSTSTPLVVVTARSVRPSPFRSAATQPSPCPASPACVLLVTSRKRPPTFSNSWLRRQPAVRVPRLRVGARVRVDCEQVEPAVAVVVEPADPAAHHRLALVRDPEAERALREVEPD